MLRKLFSLHKREEKSKNFQLVTDNVTLILPNNPTAIDFINRIEKEIGKVNHLPQVEFLNIGGKGFYVDKNKKEFICFIYTDFNDSQKHKYFFKTRVQPRPVISQSEKGRIAETNVYFCAKNNTQILIDANTCFWSDNTRAFPAEPVVYNKFMNDILFKIFPI